MILFFLLCFSNVLNLHREVCAFRDAMRANVYTSYNHFWSGKTESFNTANISMLFLTF